MTAERSTSRPNFLFITTDQQRWDALGLHNPILRTPAMDALAGEGVRFDRAYPTNAICMPARASMITGRSQRGHQVFHNISMSEAIPVLGDSLRAAGYRTALIGKAHFKATPIEDALPDDPPEGAPVSPDDGIWYGPYFGFDYLEMHTGHTFPAGHWRVWLERNHPEGLELWKSANALVPRSGAFESWKNAIPSHWHYTHWTGDRTIEWLRNHAGQEEPFFLWMSFADPHKPFAPPRPYCDMYDPKDMPAAPIPQEDVSAKPPQYRRAALGLPYGGYDTQSGWSGDHFREIVAHYYGFTTFIDDTMARVLEELDRLGLRDNTHVIFTSDHGEGLADHAIAAKPMMSYECVNRVPMFWRHPPTVEPGRVYNGVMTHLDLTPTFLDLAGAEPLSGMEGRSFAPLLRGETSSHRDAVIVERITPLPGTRSLEASSRDHQSMVPIKGSTYDPVYDAVDLRVKMLVTQDWKLLHYGSAPYGELYDVRNDPEDLNNLWDNPEYAEIRRELTERLLAELIDSELGDARLILERQDPAGALRNANLQEPPAEKETEIAREVRLGIG